MPDSTAEKAHDAVRAVIALHKPDGEGWCVEDGFGWPCPTARAVSAVMDSDPTDPTDPPGTLTSHPVEATP